MHWGTLPEILSVVRNLPIDAIEAPSLSEKPASSDAPVLADVQARRTVEPLLVRRAESDGSGVGDAKSAVLVAGEKRLFAARQSGLAAVPCVFIDGDWPDRSPEGSGDTFQDGSRGDGVLLAIVENIHREDLNLFESARAISALLALTGLTQEQCARRLGVSQSFVANKLRLLRLTEDEQLLMLKHHLTERHGRALLRFATVEERAPVLRAFAERRMNVADAEEYVESLLCADARAAARGELPLRDSSLMGMQLRRSMFSKDTRRFTESIDRAVDVIRRSGIPVESHRRDTPAGVLISILVPKSS